ncbi:MAG: D-alanyl-D-alanine carboxypeptidase/D-alanyl-D-alanine-endopeptidase [Gemmatimonadetes bacterium]|nr:D-alanyl-D-alanine carboxypeptidase/D-alanyl-D-alanine-endopeptidase [Gemmatimonadota bacterium]
MASLAILQHDARVEARLTDALSGAHDVVVRPTWKAMEEAIRHDDVEGCLIDADHPDAATASRRISALRRAFPDIAIITCIDAERAEEYFDLGCLGVDGLVVSDERPTKVRADIDAALSRARAYRIERILVDRVDGPGPEAVAWAMEHAGPETSVSRLAAALGHSPRTLRAALQEADLPGPARILLWGRLLLAGARLGDDNRRVEDVAFSLGYATATSFGRAMKVHTGLTPAAVSKKGGMEVVLEALVPPSTRLRRRSSGSGGERALRRSVRALGLALLSGVVVVASGCATLGFGSGVDRSSLEDVLTDPPFDQMHVGVLAVDAGTGEVLYDHNGHRKFIPASNQKILVTATALSLLGPDHRFRTEVWAAGTLRDGHLDGDLVLVTSGDPSLSDRYWSSGSAALAALADSVRAAGIRYVAGRVFVDVAAWDSATVGPTWEVEDLRYSYGSTGGAFAVDEGSLEAVVRSGDQIGDTARITWTPLGTHDFVRSRVVTVPSDSATRLRPSYLPETRRIVLNGTIAAGTVDTTSFATRDPVRQAAHAWLRALRRAGVEAEGLEIGWRRDLAVGGGCRSGALEACRAAGLVTAMESPALSEIVAGILEPSQNWMTEQLVRALGAQFGGRGSWNEGIGVVERFLIDEVGVDSTDIAPRDGSGLSAYNLVTPRALAAILAYMHRGPHATSYRAAMAEPAEDDSTLERRLPGLEGRLFAKTGTISNVNSLSGYLVRDDGRELVFSVLTNGSGLPASQVRQAIDEVVEILAR